MPSAATMSRSSTPARTILPKRVRLMIRYRPSPISSAAPSTITPRKNPKRTSPGSVMLVGHDEGVAMSFEMPPKPASIWSAMITLSAIVISAWRRSCPWFQRRKTCWSATPITPISSVATTSGTSQPNRPYSASDAPLSDSPRPLSSSKPARLHLQRDVAAEQVQRPVRHVDHAHQPEDQREPARDHEVQRREREPVERDGRELPQVLGRLDREEDRDHERQCDQGDVLRRPGGGDLNGDGHIVLRRRRSRVAG